MRPALDSSPGVATPLKGEVQVAHLRFSDQVRCAFLAALKLSIRARNRIIVSREIFSIVCTAVQGHLGAIECIIVSRDKKNQNAHKLNGHASKS